MASIRLIRSNIAAIDNAGNVSLGDVSVGITAPTAGNTVANVDERTDGVIVPAGKLRVKILNMGFVEDGDNEVAITVNGEPVQPGAPPIPFEAKLDPVTEVFKYTPIITIVNDNGARIRIITEE